MARFTPPESAAHAIAQQKEIASSVRLQDEIGEIKTIAGIDVGYDMRRNLGRAAIVILDAENQNLLYSAIAYTPVTFPYIPGLLSFREIPVVLKAYETLTIEPDVLMIDGHGIAHPRRVGIAAHIGVLLNKPTIGVAKKRLCGRYDEPGENKGDQSILEDRGEMIGTVLRSRTRTKPLFISPGHKISHERALDIVMQYLDKYRLPEPTRLADKLSKHL